MKCTKCGVGEVVFERKIRPLDEHLPQVMVDGLEQGRCVNCNETLNSYPRWSELSRQVVASLVGKTTRLTAGEFHFLRLKIGLKAQDLAGILGVTPSQVSRWENEAAPISALADRLLRMVVATRLELPTPDLTTIDGTRSEPLAMRVRLGSQGGVEGWKVIESDAQAA